MKIIILTDSNDMGLLIGTKKLFRTIFDQVIIKAIPMKRMNVTEWMGKDKTVLKTYESNEYDHGWNDCVDYILSEDEHE